MDADLTSKCAYLFETLKKANIQRITYEFCGSGDDGQMDMTQCVYADESYPLSFEWDAHTIFSIPHCLPLRALTFIELTEDVVDGILIHYDIDFTNGEGNQGSITLDILEGKITTSYRVRKQKESYLYV